MRSRIKIIVNATTLIVGGGIQIGKTFVEIASNSKYQFFDFLFLVSKPIFDSLPLSIQRDSRIIVFAESPASLFRGIGIRTIIRNIEKDFKPNLVYSVGFPSYIKFSSVQIGRYTNPWEINPDPLPWYLIETKRKFKFYLGIRYRIFWAKKADFIETQTFSAKKGIERRLRFKADRIKVFPNSVNPIFLDFSNKRLISEKKPDSMIFCLAADYKHKNLSIIPEVAKLLKIKYNINCKFILTIRNDSRILKDILTKSRNLQVEEMIKNVGPLTLESCIEYYRNATIVFLPTLLEVFSATYLEAMAMSVPIVTSDLEFAHDVCGNAAVYFNPISPEDAALKLSMLLLDENQQICLIENGIKKLKEYPDPISKHEMLFDWFREVVN